MKLRNRALLFLLLLALPARSLAQGYTASLVDLGSNRVVAHFATGFPGDNPTAVAWAGNSTAFVVNDDGNTLVRLDMTASPPAVTATYVFPPNYGPHALAINPSGTRALVSGDAASVYLLDLTTNPFSIVDTITVPTLDAGGVTFYSSGTKGIVVDETNVLFLDLSTVPAGVTVVSMGGNSGVATAVNAAGTRAVVTVDTGGLQTFNLTTSPPSPIGGLVGPLFADPLGVAVSPNGTRAIYVDEESPDGEANVIDISGTPSFVNSVSTTNSGFSSPSAVAFNPVSAAAVIASDDGVVILNAPYTAVNTKITDPDPAYSGATAYSIAVNPAGTFAIILNEDRPPLPNTASLVDLSSNTVVSHFVVGDNPTAVSWAGNSTAYVVNDEGNTLVRLDMTASPPAINANYSFPPDYGPHALAINPAGTRALVTGDTPSVYLLDLTTNPFSIVATVTVPTIDAGGVTFYSAGAKAVVVDETDLLFLDLSVNPPGVTTVSMGANEGLAVAVNAASTRAVVTMDLGGLQTVDLTTSPPSLIGSPVGPPFADPLGVAVSPNGTRAIYLDEEFPDAEANVVDISGTPSLLNSVSLSATVSAPSAVAFDPVSAAAVIAGDDGVVVLNSPYTSINATITDPGFAGATPYSIAVNPAGTFAVVLHEDFPSFNQITPVALAVDSSAGANSDGNSVLEPGETVVVEPSWKNIVASPVVGLNGVASDIAGPPGASYSIPDGTATYGALASGAMASCADTPDCYSISVSAPATRPVTHWDATFAEAPSTLDSPKVWTLHVGESFPDVPKSYIFYKFIENLFHNGITGGCGGGNYCPTSSVTRAQMAVFLLKAKHGVGFVPPPCAGLFPDVPCPSLFADWIEQLFAEGITGGCGGGNYCPDNPVRRDQMAAFLLKAEHGSSYVPPGCTGVFPDVACPSLFADWIERLFAEAITGGCGGGNYCPLNPNTRGQMAVFLVKTFGLLLYGP